jgi:hypothetical protein
VGRFVDKHQKYEQEAIGMAEVEKWDIEHLTRRILKGVSGFSAHVLFVEGCLVPVDLMMVFMDMLYALLVESHGCQHATGERHQHNLLIMTSLCENKSWEKI